jgi:hypothetical protein
MKQFGCLESVLRVSRVLHHLAYSTIDPLGPPIVSNAGWNLEARGGFVPTKVMDTAETGAPQN